MATIGVIKRNEANTADTYTLPAFNVEFQKREFPEPGTGVFYLRKFDSAAIAEVTFETLVRFVVYPDGIGTPAVAFPARVKAIDPVNVKAGDEDVEAIQYSCEGLLCDWERAVVRPSDLPQCDLVPSMDERIWHWSSGEYNGSLSGGGWDYADPVAGQGWGSAFYTGQPAGWTDSAAFFMWHSSGEIPPDPLSVNALAGRCLFWTTRLLPAGRKYIEWAADNYGVMYVNGRRMQEGSDFKKKQELEIETTEGFLTLAWEVVNSPDDGPVGGNPAGLIFSVRKDDPATGDIIWRSTPAYPLDEQLRVLPYPVSTPEFPVGRILRLAGEGNAVVDDWSVGGTDAVDSDGNNWDLIPDISFRFYTDTMLDVLRTLTQTWMDGRIETFGKTLRPYVKGTLASPAPVTLVTGYSAAGVADPSLVNVLDLSWNYTAPLFTKIGLRWADGWIERPDGPVSPEIWGSFQAQQINDVATATTVADRLLSLYGAVRRTASITYLPLDETTDLPLDAFDVGDTIDVPYSDGNSYWNDRIVQTVTYTGDDENWVTSIVIEAGDPVVPVIEAFEESIRRGAPGQIGGRAKGGSPAVAKAQYGHFDRFKVSSPGVGQPVHPVASAPGIGTAVSSGTLTLPHVSIAPNQFVGLAKTLRLIGQGGTGTSTVQVSDGTTTWVLSGTGEGVVDYADIDTPWDISTIITVTFVSVNHRDLHVYADVADVRGG